MITIIVLLILAGITLNLVIGDNGIINRSKQAGEEYTKASLKEELQLKIADIEMEKLAKGEQLTRDDLQDLSEIGAIIQDTEIPSLGEYKDYEFEINENFEVTIGGKLEGVKPTANAEVTTTGYVTAGGKVEIKVTANTTEGTITNIEATNGATLKTNTSDTEKYFEVSKNGTYYFKITGSNGRKTIVSVEVNTILESPQISIKNITDQGFTIVVNTHYASGAISEYQYYIEGVLAKGGITTTEYIATNYLEDTIYTDIYVKAFNPETNSWLESNKLEVATKQEIEEVIWTNNTGENRTIDAKTASYQNPKIPVGFSAVNTSRAKWNVSDGSKSDWDNGLVIKNATDENEFVWVPIDGTNVPYYRNEDPNIHDTIPENQGFWIARYEAGLPENIDQTTANATIRNVLGIPLSKPGKVPWNYINWTNAKQNAESMYSNSYVKSGLIASSQYSAIQYWLQHSGYSLSDTQAIWRNCTNSTKKLRKKYNYCSEDSGSWTVSNKKPLGAFLFKTGASQETRSNNIYDLAGNLSEFMTHFVYGTSIPRLYHAAFNEAGTNVSFQYYENIDPNMVNVSTGFRVVLYLQ